ncbi:AMP-binding protein [Leucothrix pacifica]|uniref:Long-chain-fatty-acid--CoA ligase n=1 Tax=Leucothrix pacifica TaxID=1247513 RepID=A0A317CI25_9GAMM|nr:AMP-binding protein [Leucothrix pacifica]PWQ98205.1 long-chain-fatty-acid--CoA ligase [Leucothrix pacifica]
MERIWLKQYPEGIAAEIDLREYTSLADLFRRSAERYADHVAFVSLGQELSYRNLDVLSKRMAAYLVKELGLYQGDRIALMIPNLLQYPVAVFAALRAGLTVVNIDPLCTQRELRYQLKDSGCRCVVALEDCARKLSNVVGDTDVETVILTQLADLLGIKRKTAVNFKHKWISSRVPTYQLKKSVCFSKTLRKSKSLYADPIIQPEDLALIQYTSGTEGVPKGVMLSHRNLIANTMQSASWASIDLRLGEETVVSALPLCHIFGFAATLLFPIKIGARNLLIADGRDCEIIVKLLEKYEFSMLVGVSTYFRELVRTEGFEALDFGELKLSLSGGMPVHPSVVKDWSQVTGTPIIECYGMTETSPAVTINPLHILKYNGTVGLPLPSTEVSIRDLSGNELGIDTPGELWVKGPQVMEGYWRQADATRQVMDKEGWFRTGDVAVISELGYLKVIDRIRDIVNVSGFVVYPSEVERLVLSLDSVKDAAVVAAPDDRSGEAVKLFVVPANPLEHDEEGILGFCRSKLSGYKCPKHIEFVERIPRLKSGRLLRRELRKTTYFGT